MRIVGYSLMTFGFAFVVSGIVAVFHYDQPADVFSLAWWMIVSGWGLALTGMGIDIVHVFRIAKREPAYVLQPKTNTVEGVQGEIARM